MTTIERLLPPGFLESSLRADALAGLNARATDDKNIDDGRIAIP